MTAPLRPWRRGARDRRRWTPLVTHPPNQRWRLRHGDHRSDPRPGAHGAGVAARPGGRLAADQSPQFRDQVQRTWAMRVSVRI